MSTFPQPDNAYNPDEFRSGTQAFFRKNLDYDPKEGVLTWGDVARSARGRVKGARIRSREIAFEADIGGSVRDRYPVGYAVLVREFGIDHPGGCVSGDLVPGRAWATRHDKFYPEVTYLDGDYTNLKLDNLAEGKNWRVRPNGDQWNAQVLRDGTFETVGIFDDYRSAYHEAKEIGEAELSTTPSAKAPASPAERRLAEYLSNQPPHKNISPTPDGRYRVRMTHAGLLLTVGVYDSHAEALAARNLVHRRRIVDHMCQEDAVRSVRGETRPATKYIDKHGSGWRARAYRGGRLVYVGTFASEDAAIAARDYVMNKGLSVFDAASKARTGYPAPSPDPEPTPVAANPRAKRFKQPKPRIADGVKYPRGWDRERAKAEGRAHVTSPVTAEPSLADLFNAS